MTPSCTDYGIYGSLVQEWPCLAAWPLGSTKVIAVQAGLLVNGIIAVMLRAWGKGARGQQCSGMACATRAGGVYPRSGAAAIWPKTRGTPGRTRVHAGVAKWA